MMKKQFAAICAAIAVIVFLGANMAAAQDAQKHGFCKKPCFDRMDSDKDGQVSEAEFLKQCKEHFRQMDLDNSGALSKDEFKPGCKGNQPRKECPRMKGSSPD